MGMDRARGRQAGREGYAEIAEAFKRYAFEEAEHASKFAELLGDVVWDTKTNLEKRYQAEAGACEGKLAIATRAKQLGYDAIHDTVHEMAKDEARHGAGFYGRYTRFFGKKESPLKDIQLQAPPGNAPRGACFLGSPPTGHRSVALSCQTHNEELQGKNICVPVIGRSGISNFCSSGYRSSSVRPKCSAMSSGMSPRPLQ